MRTKPTIEYDFGRGDVRMAEELPRRAVVALTEEGLPINKLQNELRSYLRAKPVDSILPRQLLSIMIRYVDIYPVDYHDLELLVGVEHARRMIPTASVIPQLAWDTQDYLDFLDPEFGTRYRTEISKLINRRSQQREAYLRVAAKWLGLAAATPSDAIDYRLRRDRRRQNKRPVPAA